MNAKAVEEAATFPRDCGEKSGSAPETIRTSDTRFRRAVEHSDQSVAVSSLWDEDGRPAPGGVGLGRKVASKRCVNRRKLDDGTVIDCKSRDFYSCPHCALLYRGDWSAIIRDGFYGLDSPARVVFLTLTAPSFGKVHRVPTRSQERVSRCACGRVHSADEVQLRGVAVDPDTYDYDGQVAWNRDAGQLWQRTNIYLRRAFPTFEFVKIWEWQARGVLHAHILIRLPPQATREDLETIRRVCLEAAIWSNVDGEYRTWGERIDVQDLGLYVPDAAGEQSDLPSRVNKVVRYVGKVLGYVAKSLTDVARGVRRSVPEAEKYYRRLDEAAHRVPCSSTCVRMGEVCEGYRHRNLGASSHVVSPSRSTRQRPGWSPSALTRQVLRARRRAWYEAREAEHPGERPQRTVELSAHEVQALILHRAGLVWDIRPLRV